MKLTFMKTLTVFRNYWRAERGALVGWAVGLAAYAYYISAFYKSTEHDWQPLLEYLNHMPAGLKALVGGELSSRTVAGWLRLELLSYLPMLASIYVSIVVAGIISKEIERGTAEFLFAQPISRARLVLTRFVGLALNLAILHLVVFGGAWVGIASIGEEFPAWVALRTVSVAWLAVMAVAALLLLISVFVPDYTRTLFTGLGVSTALYVLTVALRASGRENALTAWTIFGHYDPAKLVESASGVWEHAAILAATTIVFLTAAVLIFRRRDLRL